MLSDAITGVPYAGQLTTSHNVGGTLGIAAGALPAGLSLPASFTGSGATISGTPGRAGRRAHIQLHREGPGVMGAA